jgi:ferredoxin--NADP+ reductase
MMATGTGVGPFLSMLRTAQSWESFEKIVLAYGVRYLADLAYQEVIAALRASHPEQLVFVPLVTREDTPRALKGRITAALENGQLEGRAGIRIAPQDSHVMLCGNAGMITDVSILLEDRGLKRHRRNEPGHYSLEKYH